MSLLSSILLAIASTSGVSSSPELKDAAKPVELPVERVMVFSDRARVTRAGAVTFGGGLEVLRVPDLPGATLLDTVRVTTTGTRLVRVETQPVERERWSIDQVDAWLKALEDIGDKLAVVEGKLAAVRGELGLLAGLRVAPLPPEKDRAAKAPPPLAPDGLRAAQEQLARRRAKARATEAALEKELRALRDEYQRAQREVAARDLGGFSDVKLEVIVIVDGAGGSGAVRVEYAVPGAFWLPAYELAFDPDAGSVELKAAGLVTQATGEDWPKARLSLSTAIPGSGIDLPALMTWTLGDDREYVPRPYPRAQPRTTRPFQPPEQRPRIAELEREADRAVLEARSQTLLALVGGIGSAATGTGIGSLGGGRGAKSGAARDSDRQLDLAEEELEYPAEPEPMSAPSSSRSAPPSAAAPMPMQRARANDRRSASDNAQVRGLALFPVAGKPPPQFADARLPAVAAGGLDYVYDAPVVVTVPADAESLRVPLAARSYDVQTFYEATPSLAKTAYLKATVKNGSKLPILAGPANVFVKGAFVGEAALATTGPGGTLELPLGADEDIRLTHTVIPASKSQGFLIGEEDVTEYAVKIEVGNYKKRAVTVRVVDQLPKSNAEKIKVQLVGTDSKPQTPPDADGVLHWHVDVPPGGTRTIAFSYRIVRPKGWRLSQ